MDCTIIAPTKEHLFTLILLHEQDSNGKILYESLNQIAQASPTIQESLTRIKLVFPHGPMSLPPIGETNPRAWIAVDNKTDTDMRMWHQAGPVAKALGKVVDEEGDKVGRRNVFVGGHGMGCAIGFAVLLYLDAPVGGFFGAAPFMLFADTIDKPATKPANKPASVQKQDHVFKKPAIPPRAAKDSDLAKAVDPRLWLSYFQARDDPQQPTGQQPTTTPSPSTPAANKDRLHEIVGLLRSYSGALGKKALETMQRLGFRASLDLLDVGQHEVTTHMIEKFLIEFLKTRGSG